MAGNEGVFLELFPPPSWDEEGIRLGIEIADQADTEHREEPFWSPEEVSFLAKCIVYWSTLPEDVMEHFSIDVSIDFDDPDENGMYVIDMDFPEHLEPPASLR